MFGLCFSTAVQRVNRPMLCKAGGSRLGSVEAVPVAINPCHGSVRFSTHFALRQALPGHQRPNLLFKPDWLRQPA